MNVIFHRNCLDGVFSSFLTYLAAKLITEDELSSFINSIKEALANGTHDLTNHQSLSKIPEQSQEVQLNQQFFHTPRGVYFNAFSFFAGEYYPLKFPGSARLLLILDTNLSSLPNLKDICMNHELVILIDHHTSFLQMKDSLAQGEIKNLAFVFDEQYAASLLTFGFLSKFLNFHRHLTPAYTSSLNLELQFVSANDTKKGESKESKAFVLGFYYFEIEISHLNPNLYKRVGTLDLQYLLERGRNLYASHLAEIKEEIKNAKIVEFTIGNMMFKSKKCFYIEPHNAGKISDIGNVLAYLSVKNNMENLCLLAMKKQSEIRISCRSHRHCKDPYALLLSKLFTGGGHTEAAGFKITANQFRNNFKVHSLNRFGVSIGLDEEGVEEILLMGYSI